MHRRFRTRAFSQIGSGRTQFCYPKRHIDVVETFGALIDRLIAPRPPPQISVFEDALLVSNVDGCCLFDRDGHLIEASRLVRYADDPAPEFLPPEPKWERADADAFVRETVLFGSHYFPHWGHFLTESLARLWPIWTQPDCADLDALLALAWHAKTIDGPFAEALAHLDVKVRPVMEYDRSVRLAKVLVPSPTFVFGTSADPLHREGPLRIVRKLIGESQRDERPVYLSRSDPALSGHAYRRLINEAELEHELESCGVRVVHLQKLDLAEQIAIFNTHRVFIGPWGSAFHNLLFSLSGADITTYVLIGPYLPRDFVLIDHLVGNAAHYLVMLSRAQEPDGAKPMTIDIEATLAYLREQGVI